MMHKIALPFAFFALFVASCRDRIKTDTSARLEYSSDTVMFDTVFTDMGTRTIEFKVYNPSDGRIVVDRLYVSEGKSSDYIVNVNGQMLMTEQQFEIHPHDSVYLFIQAKLKEQGADTAVFHQENLVLEYNRLKDELPVISFGQDVNRIRAKSIGTEMWTGRKPYVLYDSLHIQKGETLTIGEGITVYCHAGSKIVAEGTLICNGTLEAPVVFRPDNFDTTSYDLPKQWGSLVLKDSQAKYVFNHTKILRGTNGILANFSEYSPESSITLSNTEIKQMSYAGVFAHNANIIASNVVVAHNSVYAFSFSGNGKHAITHATIAKGNAFQPQSEPCVRIQDSAISQGLELIIRNSIISDVSRRGNEIGFPNESVINWIAKIENSVVYMEDDIAYMPQFVNCIQMQDTSRLFRYGSKPDFLLDSLSVARDIAMPEAASLFPVDLLGNSRVADGKPDAGAMEYIIYGSVE